MDEDSGDSDDALEASHLCSSPPQSSRDLDEDLKKFRSEWKKEIETSQSSKSKAQSKISMEVKHDLARRCFLEGAKHEREGQLVMAIKQYKRAVQLVPDIEKSINMEDQARFNVSGSNDIQASPEWELNMDYEVGINDSSKGLEENSSMSNLVDSFTSMSFKPEKVHEDDNRKKHIQDLPPEIVLMILKWVVSPDLDLKSLENCALVCKSFFVAARSQEIWRLVCKNMWNSNLLPLKVKSWRRLFLSLPRVFLNGCYIAKISYIREGERGFQDNEFYHSWHMVNYFRYIRFFSGGQFVMTTCSIRPKEATKLLKKRCQTTNDVRYGTYEILNNIITGKVVEKASIDTNKKWKSSSDRSDAIIREYYFELEICGKKRNQLKWLKYLVTCYDTEVMKSNIDVRNGQTFPNMRYFPIKSYVECYSEAKLE